MRKQDDRKSFDHSCVIEQLYYLDEMMYEFKRGKDLDSFADRATGIFMKLCDRCIQQRYPTIEDFSREVTFLIKDMKNNHLHTNKVFNELLIVARIEILDQLDHINGGLFLLKNARGDAFIRSFKDQLKLDHEMVTNNVVDVNRGYAWTFAV